MTKKKYFNYIIVILFFQMERVPTALATQPHHTIPKESWSQFVSEYPKCSKPYPLPDNQKEKYKFLSALMMANILDSLISW